MARTASELPVRRLIAVVALLLAFGVVLAGVELHWGWLRSSDTNTADWFHTKALDHPGTVTWWQDVSRVLHPTVLRILAAVVAAALWWVRRRRAAVFLVVAVAGATALDSGLKAAVGRHRPRFAVPVAHASGASFPSGHAFTSIVTLGAVVLLLPPARRVLAAAVAVVGVVLVGVSRVALGVHYVSDVVGAWLLGAAWLIAVEWLVVSRSPRAAAPPTPDPPQGTPAC